VYLSHIHRVQSLFEGHGTIVEKKIIRERNAERKSMGYGFVKFSTEEEAASAITHLNGIEIDDKNIKVSYARPPSKDIKDCKLFATNFPSNFNKDECRRLFGEVRQLKFASA
jgi:RNA recognition motif-containing protein